MLTFEGEGLLNTAINKLPFELHLPASLTSTYNFCGPGTRLKERLARGDRGINPLDEACREHDIAYSQHKDLTNRHRADAVLENKAWERVKAKDASFGERSAAWLVTNAMKTKRKLGMGLKKKKRAGKALPFMSMIQKVAQRFKHDPISLIGDIGEQALTAAKIARRVIKEHGAKKKDITFPRVIPLPKTGGFLPLIPLILGGLSAAGALAGGGAGIAKAVNDAKSTAKMLEESERHNRMMEAIALGKKGSGLYLKKCRDGFGLFLKKQPKN